MIVLTVGIPNERHYSTRLACSHKVCDDFDDIVLKRLNLLLAGVASEIAPMERLGASNTARTLRTVT